jgi:hypothetical protein
MKQVFSVGIGSACALIAALAFTPVTRGQSLGELARRERDHHKVESKKSKKVYTNDDIPSVGPPAPEVSAPPPSSPDQNKKPTAEAEAESEKQWKQRFAQARMRVRDAEQNAWQTRIQTVFVGGSGITGMTRGATVPVQMQVREFVETEELRQAQKALADLEDELRRAGLPPGWARE